MDKDIKTDNVQEDLNDFTYTTCLTHHESTASYGLIPDFGVMHLTVHEAAVLISVDMWYEDKFPELTLHEDWDGDGHHPQLIELLEPKIQLFTERLCRSINLNFLSSPLIFRDFDEKIVPNKTYIQFEELEKWLIERGYDPNDVLETWFESELNLIEHIRERVQLHRAVNKINSFGKIKSNLKSIQAYHEKLDENNLSAVLTAYKQSEIVIASLKLKIKNLETGRRHLDMDTSLSTRERNTLLKIIKALCNSLRLNIDQPYKAAEIIKNELELLGYSISEETIATKLIQLKKI